MLLHDGGGDRSQTVAALEELGYLETAHVGWRDDTVVLMGPRLTGYSGVDVDDLTAVEIESRRRYLETLLGNIAAGVVSTAHDTHGRRTIVDLYADNFYAAATEFFW